MIEEPTAVHNDLLSIGLRAVREGLTAEEFESKYGDQLKEPGDKANKNKTIGRMGRPVGNKFAENTMDASRPSSTDCRLSSIVLKVTTLSEVNAEAPSYVVGMKGARIGRGAENDISVTADVKMYPVGHAFIEYADGSFYFRDGGFDFSASVRLVPNKKQWVLEKDACFSAGSSVFRSCGSNAEGHLLVEITGGPLRGERRFVTRKGVSIGRSGDNNIALPDKELSRKHSKIVFDDVTSKYFVCDVGSTNGTYMQLVGPYANRYKLSLNDNILVGRTGFAVNRFDYGLSEEMGQRQSMEDSTAIFQQLKIPGLTNVLLTPASYFAVYDGHGGPQASAYLSQNLHVNVVEALVEAAKGIQSAAGTPAQDGLVTAALSKAFLKTDQKFLDTSENPEHGSTATTVLILGERIYCANVGDSRTILCRNFTEVLMSHDHKPTREDEARRIKDAGGYIIANRVMGELAVSRAFGDLNFKKTVKVFYFSFFNNNIELRTFIYLYV